MYKHFSLEIIKNDDFERECTRPNKHSILHLAWYETCSDKKRDGEKKNGTLIVHWFIPGTGDLRMVKVEVREYREKSMINVIHEDCPLSV